MEAYETLVLISKILAGIYLLVIPWTISLWVWVPGFTGLLAIGLPFGILFNKPSDNGNPAAMEHINNDWAIQLFASIGYAIYFFLAVVATIYLQTKWYERQDRKNALRFRPQPIDNGEYFVVRSTGVSKSTRKDTPIRQITSRPHNSS